MLIWQWIIQWGFKTPLRAPTPTRWKACGPMPSATFHRVLAKQKLFAGYMGSYMLRRKLGGERWSNSFLSFVQITDNYWSRSEQGEPEFSVLLEEEWENIVSVPSPIQIRIRIANGPNGEKTYRIRGREPFVPRRSMRLRRAATDNEWLQIC